MRYPYPTPGQFFGELWRACPIPLVLVALALTRNDAVLGIFFSPHGGIEWFLLMLAFPWAIARALYLAFSRPPSSRLNGRLRAYGVLLLYAALSLISATILTAVLAPPLSLRTTDTLLWFFFPLVFVAGG